MFGFATHYIKIHANINENKWHEKELKDYCNSKLREVDDYFKAELENFQFKEGALYLEVLISAAYMKNKQIEEDSKEWITNHIKEEGITLKDLLITKIPKRNFLIRLKGKNDKEISV